ncbi:HAD family hydrolase [Aquimarina spongiae]|uniref:Putative hydrolase of the HAD superfamily n=1 Tax=Aquimarina spongiae TaxID=570521 RepID=A0A1M6G2D9_9FLAO|nr:HAD family phosphatase [Aquimarina spongiae]SHJ04135.1 putative hydrolase of the HAD superfamily [Aquimarina spongiae]
MIKTIIFDFGDVFINLDKPATLRELSQLGDFQFNNSIQDLNNQYEVGKITTEEFIRSYHNLLPQATEQQLIEAWNAILLDFPKYRLDFVKHLAATGDYKLILLSNTNELHINWIKQHISFYEEFKSCFDSFYLSHEIQYRKPNSDIFEFVLQEHQIQPTETLFVDDTKENTDAAQKLGVHIWNNNPKADDVIDLFTSKSDLF